MWPQELTCGMVLLLKIQCVDAILLDGPLIHIQVQIFGYVTGLRKITCCISKSAMVKEMTYLTQIKGNTTHFSEDHVVSA